MNVPLIYIIKAIFATTTNKDVKTTATTILHAIHAIIEIRGIKNWHNQYKQRDTHNSKNASVNELVIMYTTGSAPIQIEMNKDKINMIAK